MHGTHVAVMKMMPLVEEVCRVTGYEHSQQKPHELEPWAREAQSGGDCGGGSGVYGCGYVSLNPTRVTGSSW